MFVQHPSTLGTVVQMQYEVVGLDISPPSLDLLFIMGIPATATNAFILTNTGISSLSSINATVSTPGDFTVTLDIPSQLSSLESRNITIGIQSNVSIVRTPVTLTVSSMEGATASMIFYVTSKSISIRTPH